MPRIVESQSAKIEEMLWISLRMFEERRNLLRMTKAARTAALERSTGACARETQGYIDRIRGLLLAPGSDAAGDTLARVKALMAEPRKVKSARG
jgi:two-component system chemotaxis response regulator CheB